MKKTIALILAVLMILTLAGCSDNSGTTEAVVYDDMKESLDNSGMMSANIGIFTKVETDGQITYENGGSGVVFRKDGGYYYAFTAAHVVSSESDQLLVYTTNTDMKSDDISGLEDVNILSQETYDSMLKAKAVFISDKDDFAVIRFKTEVDLAVAELAESDPAVGDRILCVGNPQNDWFAISCGEVTSELDEYGEFNGYPTYAMKHSAYIQVGSSGGAAFNEDMKLVGITPGAGLSLDGSTFKYGVLIPVSEINSCLEAWDS